jgi:hypothetical protein
MYKTLDTVRGGRRGYCIQYTVQYVGDHFLKEFNTLYLTRFKTYKNYQNTPNKNLRGRGPQTDKHLPQSPFTGKLYLITTFGNAFYQSFYGVYPSLLNLKQFVL